MRSRMSISAASPPQASNQVSLPVERRDFLALMLGGMAVPLAVGSSHAAPQQSGRDVASVKRTLNAFLDVLIPADELSPSASALGIAERILDEAKDEALFMRLIRVVVAWLDNSANKDFAALDEKRKVAIVEWMAAAPWESPQRRFFEIMRDRAMWFYYGHAESWGGLPLNAPPQPAGYALE